MKHIRLLAIVGVCALAVGMGSPSATQAATTTASAAIGATIANTCSIGAVTNPTAPTLTGGVAPSQISGSFPVTCTSGDATTISLNSGLNGSGGGTSGITRNVKNGANTLGYQIYQTSGTTTIWGDLAGTNTKAVTGNGAAQTQTFYVSFNTPALTLPAGSYTDTVTITVSY